MAIRRPHRAVWIGVVEDATYRRAPSGYVFAVADSPFCCWEHDHEERTLDILRGIDVDYFGTVAVMLAEHLTSNVEMSASIALRATYQQGIEALMSLLGAAAQAPSGVPAWIAKCGSQDLKEVVSRLSEGRPLLTQIGWRRVTFLELSQHVHRYAWTDESGDDSTASRYGRFWRRLSNEVLDETARAEYNAIKHGNRVSAGGFHLAIRLEERPGVAAAPEAMRSLGGSQFGSSFYRAEPVGTSKWHIRTRRVSVNWSADALVQRLSLVSMSISNVVAALQCDLEADPRTVQFHRPAPLTAFDTVWDGEPGVRHSSIDTIVQIGTEDELTRSELKAILERRGEAELE
jgi:hypothetical protein